MVKKNSVISAILLVCVTVSAALFISCTRGADDRLDDYEPEKKVSGKIRLPGIPSEDQPSTGKSSNDRHEKDNPENQPKPDSSDDKTEKDSPADRPEPDNDEPYAIRFEDEAFEKAMRKFTDKPKGVILGEDLEKITMLAIEGEIYSNSDKYTINYSKLYGNVGFTETISDVRFLKELEHLQIINLAIDDFSAVKELPKLKYLGIYNTKASDISVLEGMTNLEILNLYGSDIKDISALKGLENLTELGLWNNQIRDISALKGLTKLELLSLAGNPISDDQFNELREALPNTFIYLR